jgi:Holliday junction DNA helicase RuvA
VIASLRGPVIDRGVDHLVIAVGGVGLRAFCSPTLAAGAVDGADVTLYTHLHLREDAIALYGFASKPELAAFESLIGVSGVGPKVGLSLLSTLGVDRVSLAISNGDVASLVRVPGIGRKTAERIVLELKDKFRSGSPPEPGVDGVGLDDVAAALVSLGYSAVEAEEAARNSGSDGTTEERILAALKALGQR